MNEEIVVRPAATPNRLYKLSPVMAAEIRGDPEFIRLPPPRGRCKFCSLSRSTLIEYLPYIKHVRLRKEGSTRAIVLIHLQSLREFFEARMSTPKPATINKRKDGAGLS